MKKSLVLTGMMGVGKSTIGKILAKKLSFNFIDIDKLIEEKEGCSINLIFKTKSEYYFRKIETAISLNELKKKNSIIALGGGAFMNKSIRRAVLNLTVSFWLDVDINELIQRLHQSKKRPLLNKKNLKETIDKIYLDRKNIYNRANFKIKCNFSKPGVIADKILKLYEKSGN